MVQKLVSMMAYKINMTFNQISELINQKKYKQALEKIEENQKELFLSNPIDIVNNHIFILLELGRYSDALKVIEIYQDYPYINSEVLIHLNTISKHLPSIIEKAIEEKNKAFFIDENGVDIRIFKSNNAEEVLRELLLIMNLNKAKEYENEIEIILNKNLSDQVNFACLSLLYSCSSRKLVVFQYKNSSFSVDFSTFKFPSSEKDVEYHAILKRLKSKINDVTIFETSKTILDLLRYEVFPDCFKEEDVDFIVEAIEISSKKLFNQNIQISHDKKVDYYINLINKII